MIRLYRKEFNGRITKIADIKTDELSDAIKKTQTIGDRHWAEDDSNFDWLDTRCKITDDDSFEFEFFRSTECGDLLVKDNTIYVIGEDVSLL